MKASTPISVIRPLFFYPALVLVGLSGPLAARQGEPAALLAAVQDTLATMLSTTEVARLGKDKRLVVSDEALRHAVDGFTQLRLADLGDGRRAVSARKAFEKARDSNPRWSYPLYGIGLARLAEARWKLAEPLNIGTRVGVGDRERAFSSFVASLSLEPGFTVALAAAGQTALLLRTPAVVDSALSLFRHGDRSKWQDPGLWLLLGRLEMRAGSRDSAVTALDEYLSRGGLPGLGLLELARARLARGDEAHAEYFRGVELAGPEALHGYRRDIQYLASEEELEEFDAAGTAAERRMFLERFWRIRDAFDLRTSGDRLREHYRRLWYARRHFWLDVTRRHYWSDARFDSQQLEFDDRGIIYLRHGEPDLRLTPFVYGSTGNESWRYQRPDGYWFIHFCAQGSLRDYRLIESALDISFSRCNTGPADPGRVLESRYALDPIYSKLSGWGANGRRRLLREEREIGRTSLAAGVSSDSHLLRFNSTLTSRRHPVSLGMSDGGTLVHLPFAVARPGPSPLDSTGAARVRLSVLDDSGAPLAMRDTLVSLVRSPDTLNPWSHGLLSFELPPGVWRYRAAFSLGDSAGVVLPMDTLVVRDFGRATVSDIVVGSRQVPSFWLAASGDTVYSLAGNRFPLTRPLELHYEIYHAGLSEYQVTLAVVGLKRGGILGLFKGSPGKMEFSFKGTGSGRVTPVGHSLDLSSLSPGRYRLSLTVSLAGGIVLERHRELELAD